MSSTKFRHPWLHTEQWPTSVNLNAKSVNMENLQNINPVKIKAHMVYACLLQYPYSMCNGTFGLGYAFQNKHIVFPPKIPYIVGTSSDGLESYINVFFNDYIYLLCLP